MRKVIELENGGLFVINYGINMLYSHKDLENMSDDQMFTRPKYDVNPYGCSVFEEYTKTATTFHVEDFRKIIAEYDALRLEKVTRTVKEWKDYYFDY